ncbi:MAG: nucleotide exchange factor GrpE [Cytophagales bacterium]|nr:nucleotide exchange factor GrpE [Cytophagales bacterium]MDW8384374.1 nucleotide exchange factor GrpE [Flammeovirgaceae bacterium]
MEQEMKENLKEHTEIVAEENKGEESSNIDEQESKASFEEVLTKLQADLAEAKDKYLRLYADFENFRRRTAKEKIDMIHTASESVIKDLLVVLDDFERAFKNFPEESSLQPIKEGYELIYHKLKRTLESKGLKTLEVKQGDVFDTEKHEAITQFAAPNEEMKGKVIEVAEKGYLLGEKVLRFAKVVVGI